MTEIFNQLIYEYQKGMRDLVLYTCGSEYMQALESLFKKHKISYKIRTLDCGKKMNVFFGNPDCLEILEGFSSEDLSELTKEEDFIFGIMLGYSRKEQYRRYLS